MTETPPPPAIPDRYVVIAPGTTWPRVDDPADVEWRLRYGTPTREDHLIAASYIAAYRTLVAETENRRRLIVRELRAAWKVKP